MALMRIVEPGEQALLLALARRSISEGMDLGSPLRVEPEEFSPGLQSLRGNFVTLKLAGELRGCIGSLEADKPLVQGIADNSFNAAFRDPRFNPLSPGELAAIELEISVLSPPEAMLFESQSDALSQLHVGVDGLILTVGIHRATFLPSVWQQLPDATQFLRELKCKAGLAADYWSGQVKLQRYRSQSFSDRASSVSDA